MWQRGATKNKFFFDKGLYYLKLSITPGLCIIKMHTADKSQIKSYSIGFITYHEIMHYAYGGGPMRRSLRHPCCIKMSLAVVSSHAETSIKRSRNSTRCNMDHEWSKLVHRYITCKRETFCLHDETIKHLFFECKIVRS